MLLVFEPGEGERRAFWVTRRQWLNLYAGLGPLKPEKPQAEAKQPAAKPQPLPESVTTGAVKLDSVRFKREDDVVQVGFVAEGNLMGMRLQGESLERMKHLVFQQADTAGWDPNAAMVRLRAAAAANAAVRKAAKS